MNLKISKHVPQLILLSLVTLLMLVNKSIAQAPNAIPYQGVARNASGAILASQAIGLRFSIHDGTASGTVVYQETQSTTTTALGLFTVNIGMGTPVTGTLSSVNWGVGAKFIQVELDATGGVAYVDMGTTQLMSVPYALFAGTAGNGVTVHFIGESYGGGKVFYVYDNGQHGLIAATADQNGGTAVRWYAGSFTNTMAYGGQTVGGTGIGAGKSNTDLIIANQGLGDGGIYAARVCHEYSVTVGGVTYEDWYLPSLEELNLLYLQKNVVGVFAVGFYWSSTEYATNDAWSQYFTNGFQNYVNGKVSLSSVRAVRAF